jgi:hypothetical protein
MAKLDKPRRLAEPQYLHEQAPQGHQMPAPECADGAEIRLVQPSHRHHVHPLFAGTRQMTGGNKLMQRSRKVPPLVHIPRPEGLAHKTDQSEITPKN